MAQFHFEERPGWRHWVTPRGLEGKPVHRWYTFPHSFTGELVHSLIDEWGLTEKDHLLDPFVGAGTTLLAAKEKGVPATGYDLSPLAVLASRVKIANYRVNRLREAWHVLQHRLNPAEWNGASRDYPELVEKALPGRLLGAFDAMQKEIDRLPCSPLERDFFHLALLRIIPKYSRAVATGGWLSWVENRANARSLPSAFSRQVELMLADVADAKMPRRNSWRVCIADARRLPDAAKTYSAVITSPPYPNRHDYTRVFGVELMFGFLDWEETRELRYQSFHSHPEARPERPEAPEYKQPKSLRRAISELEQSKTDPRIRPLLEGYFLDMYLCLSEVSRVCRKGAKAAFVIGNAQYSGVPIAVDCLTAEIGEQAGLRCEKILTARYRGNSAQQMGRYGRAPSRESIVVFKNEGGRSPHQRP